MAVADYVVNVHMLAGTRALRPGERIEFDVTTEDQWAAVVTAGWVSSATSNAINEPDEDPNPDWTDPTP